MRKSAYKKKVCAADFFFYRLMAGCGLCSMRSFRLSPLAAALFFASAQRF
jgi:hypothetical protein